MPETPLDLRLNNLKEHLKEENNILHDVVDSFRELDKVAYKLGLLNQDQSYAIRVSWWPMISVLGTYSAGKSTFLNHYLGQKQLQRTGSHAVDDKFTVICFSSDDVTKTLPGIALDADPRFPFYQISQEILDVTDNPGQRIDAYLQLKTCPSERLRGKILIDSPGFDADSQRTSTLRITQHIINLSDLVLVFFDARHPEPGAMRDTLEHLVAETIERPDATKFVYILNQMDITAREDNPEEVVAAWQRSLAQAGLTAGRFYRIYNQEVCMPLPDKVKERFETKCKTDMKEIHERMMQVGVDRAYRVIGMLEHTAKDIEHNIVPKLQSLIQRWKTRVFRTEMILGVLFIILAGFLFAVQAGTGSTIWNFLTTSNSTVLGIVLGVVVVVGAWLHIQIGKMATHKILKQLQSEIPDAQTREGIMSGFIKNTGTWRTLFIWFINKPVGWNRKMHLRIGGVLSNVNKYIQKLNDRFTDPSGKTSKPEPKKPNQEPPKTVTQEIPEPKKTTQEIPKIENG